MSLGIASFDELNKLVGMKRSVPFEQYFAPMRITKKQKEERKRLAEELEDEFIYMMSYMFYAYPNITADMADELQERYMNTLIELGIAIGVAQSIEEYQRQAARFSIEVVGATQRHKDDPYYYSKDRARLCAEDQSNFIYDISDFADAIESGYLYKTWNTVADNRVRDSHAEVEGLTIPIDEPFSLQGGYMMAPHDSSLGVDESELIMCRCSLSFGCS